jgi:hypothetical protein
LTWLIQPLALMMLIKNLGRHSRRRRLGAAVLEGSGGRGRLLWRWVVWRAALGSIYRRGKAMERPSTQSVCGRQHWRFGKNLGVATTARPARSRSWQGSKCSAVNKTHRAGRGGGELASVRWTAACGGTVGVEATGRASGVNARRGVERQFSALSWPGAQRPKVEGRCAVG